MTSTDATSTTARPSPSTDGPERNELLRRAIEEIRVARAEAATARRAVTAPIAVVGLACRFPGGVVDAESFWTLLTGGGTGISEVPADRWDVDAYYSADPTAPDRSYARHGGFVDDVRGFDADLFGIPPREAASIDPQHRMMLEVAWEAFEDAGLAPDRMRGTNTGVFVGMGGSDYERLIVAAGGVSELGGYAATGGSSNMAANRVSYALGLEGPSMVVDTACSSSLVAVHLASQALRLGECDTALVGGVNLLLSPESTVTLAKGKMLSPTGQCHTFDVGADGYVRGEGCGAVVLCPLDTALRNSMNVLAVLRGSAVNQDGASSGLTVPRGSAQQDVIHRALGAADVAPSDIDYVECHGTGTSIGDPIEIKALAAALGAGRSTARSIVIGSVKANIGHLEAAAGIAGLIKTVLVVRHGIVPPQRNLVTPNPLVDWRRLPVAIARMPVELPDGERLAGVSSFGFGGTNAHVVVSLPPVADERPLPTETPAGPALVKISGTDAAALRRVAERLADHLRTADVPPSLGDVAYAAGVGRADLAERAVVLAESLPALLADLDALASEQPMSASAVRGRGAAHRPTVALVLPGPADGPARDATEHSICDDRIIAVIDDLIEALRGTDDTPVRDLLATAVAANDIHIAPFVLGVAVGRWWESIGVQPDLVAGHGVGAYAAAVIAGVMDLRDAANLVIAESTGHDVAELLTTTSLKPAQAQVITDAPTDVLHLGPATTDYWRARAVRPIPAGDVEIPDRALVIGTSTDEVFERAGRLTAAARLWVAGGRLDWSRVNGTRPHAMPRLPGYAFEHRSYWSDGTSQNGVSTRRHWLPPVVLRTATGPTIAQTTISLATMPFLNEHRVHGHTVVPGVVFLELVLQATTRILGDKLAVADFRLQRPLVLTGAETATLQAVLTPAGSDSGQITVQVFSSVDDGDWYQHLECSLGHGSDLEDAAAKPSPPEPDLVEADFYTEAWHPEFRLGGSFRLVTRWGRGFGIAVGEIREPDSAAQGLTAGIRSELLRLDAAVQLIGAARPGIVRAEPVHLGTGYERLIVYGRLDHPVLRCVATLRGYGATVGDLVLYAPDGTAVAELLGVGFRPITSTGLDRLAGCATSDVRIAPLDRARFDRADIAERTDILAAHLADLLAAIRRSPAAELARDTPLVDLADSLMLAELQREVERTTGVHMSLEALLESPGIDDLADCLLTEFAGNAAVSVESTTSAPRRRSRDRRKSVAEMLELADLPSDIGVRSDEPAIAGPGTILLTGATGYVGAFLLDELLRRTDADVVCLVRAADEEQAHHRVVSNLQRYGIGTDRAERIRTVPGDLGETRLGLSENAFAALHAQVGSVLHCGGAVKWTYPYRGLAPANVDGTREVLRLATLGDPRPLHFISTVGVFSSIEYDSPSVDEDEPLERSGPLTVGYAQTKWVAERMVRTAAERGLPTTIHRINTGWHSISGAFNRMDHLMMILKGCIESGLAPDTMAMPVQPAPIDVVARGIVTLMGRPAMPGSRTYHLVHDRPVGWNELFALVEQHGFPMRHMTFDRWRTAVTGRDSGTLALLGLAPFLEDTADDVRLPVSTAHRTLSELGDDAICPPINAELVGTLLRAFVDAGFIAPPSAS